MESWIAQSNKATHEWNDQIEVNPTLSTTPSYRVTKHIVDELLFHWLVATVHLDQWDFPYFDGN